MDVVRRPDGPARGAVTCSAYVGEPSWGHLVLAFEEALVQGSRVGLGLSVQAAHALEQAPRFSRVFHRCPVLVGRDVEVANCVLHDVRVSRLHASFDIREGWICVRDSGSTNGTFVNGERIPFDRWIAAGEISRTCEIRIAEWTLKVSASQIDTTSPPDDSDFLTAVPPEPAPEPAPGPAFNGTMVSGAMRPNLVDGQSGKGKGYTAQLADFPTFPVIRAWGILSAARNELVSIIAEAIESAPHQQRPQLVRDIMLACEGIEREPGVRAILERHGGAPLPHTLESGAALSLQELARWYVNDQPPITNATEVFAFARKLKAGIDELLLGLVPMFAGLDRFEQQLALRPPDAGRGGDLPRSARLPRVPRDAARLLFNWRDPTDNAVRAVRTDLVDLTMHQVAVLNGVMRGVKQLLAELAPGTIEVALRRKLEKRGFFGRIFSSFGAAKDRWDLYRERHGDLADEENERFRVIFGPEFVTEYKQSGETVAYPGRSSPPAQLPSVTAAHAAPAAWPPPQQRPPDPQNRN
jgi:hypothetical protein